MARRAPCDEGWFVNPSTRFCLKKRHLYEGIRGGFYHIRNGRKCYIKRAHRLHHRNNHFSFKRRLRFPFSVKDREYTTTWRNQVGSTDTVLLRTKKDIFTIAELRRMQPGQWLNDSCIQTCADVILSHKTTNCHILNSHYFNTMQVSSLQKMERQYDRRSFSAFDHLMYPVNITNTHWILLHAIRADRRLVLYDSLHAPHTSIRRVLQEHLQALTQDAWTTEVGDCPRQTNAVDCGVFVLCTMLALSRSSNFTFSQRDMNWWRLWFCNQLRVGHAVGYSL
jgi:Ulp1 family protease